MINTNIITMINPINHTRSSLFCFFIVVIFYKFDCFISLLISVDCFLKLLVYEECPAISEGTDRINVLR